MADSTAKRLRSDVLDPAVLSQVAGLSLRARKMVEGYVSGLHRSPFRGFSAEFADHRQYVAGDDLRYVDWKVAAKRDKVYVKRYEAETNLLCYALVDCSESMAYQSQEAPWSKFACAQTAAAALAYVVLRQQDSCGLVTFADEVRDIVPPKSNPANLGNIVTVLEGAEPRGNTKLGAVLHELAGRILRRSVVLVISDALADVQEILTGLKHLRHRQHDVLLMQVLDPAELTFPFDRLMLFRGLEALPDVLVDPAALRKAYLAEFTRHCQRLQAGCRTLGVQYSLVNTGQRLDLLLAALLAKRSSAR